MTTKWIRTCQECGHQQADTEPDSGKATSASYDNRKCKRCKSEGLDYGSTKHFDDEGFELSFDYDSNSWVRWEVKR